MLINIEPLRRKESANRIEFDYMADQSAVNNYCDLLGAEKVGSVTVSGNISQKNGLVAIEYSIEAEFSAGCARCNKETRQTIIAGGEKYIAGKSEEKDGNEDFYITEVDGIIDLKEFLNEFLGLEVPSRYLCSDGCKGLCLKCGKDLNEGACGCPKAEKNPAFKILDDFFKE